VVKFSDVERVRTKKIDFKNARFKAKLFILSINIKNVPDY